MYGSPLECPPQFAPHSGIAAKQSGVNYVKMSGHGAVTYSSDWGVILNDPPFLTLCIVQ
jgi:hypothetical protein